MDLDASGRLRSAGDAPLLPLAAEAARRGRYLPVDAPAGRSTVAEALLAGWPGPRALGYGPARRWAEAVTLDAGRTLSGGDDEALEALSPARVATVTWRTLPLPRARRTVVGGFRDAGTLLRALAPLVAERPPALVSAELCDRVAARWLLGRDPRQPFTLFLRAEGETELAALAWRKAWQSVELAGGVPSDLARGSWRWGAVLPEGGPPAARLCIEAAPQELPAWMEAVGQAGAALGGSALRAHVLLGVMWAWLPAGPRLDEALSLLRRRAAAGGARCQLVDRPPSA